VIKCSAGLENALHRRAFHINELRPLLMSHLVRSSKPDINGSSNNASYDHTQRVSISHTDMFTLKTEFHRVLKTTPGADQQQKYYLYSEVINLMYRYVLSHPHFMDTRNPKLAILRDDLLGAVFGIKRSTDPKSPR
jgi:hypothetical protein